MWPKFESLDKLVLEEWPWFDSLDTEVRELWKVSFELRWCWWVSFELHRGVEDKLEKSASISTTWLVNMVKRIISVVLSTCALSLLIFWKTVKSTLI